jgi:transcriptional regulator with XRE-family HTH domain
MDALPFCSLKLKSNKPLSRQYPKEINTLGEHLRQRRLDLGLLQKEVAGKIGVTAGTIYDWERQRTLPEIRFIARIIEFLGYDPIPEPESFPEKLKTRRLKMGLSQKKLGIKLGIDPGTIWKWEKGMHKPVTEYRKLIFKILRVDYEE